MSDVRRVYVEKKPKYAVQAKGLSHELRHYLGISSIKNVRILIRYDIENISDEIYEQAKTCVFSEPPVDVLYEEEFPCEGRSFSVAYLPGQYDQRADSAEQCIRLLKESEKTVIKTATTYVIEGDITDDDLSAIKNHVINPVDSSVVSEVKPETLITEYPEPDDVMILEGFCDKSKDDLDELYKSLSLAMTFADFLHIQRYFAEEEKRDPSITEIRVLDTYWSDHCRHTTFSTELTNIAFEEGKYKARMTDTYNDYLDNFKVLYKDRDDKFVCLMDLALMAMKILKRDGKLEDQEESDEINACSIVVPIEVDGKCEEWLLNFKNETHNHPTEIEPFGGAATCLGGAIRDPLSGRTYVYQAMRVTGASDPTVPVEETLDGKLPQKKIVREAARGYSSYGNQIGLATGYVHEIYHPDYVAKRMEIGAVMAAAPRRAVQRLTSDPGDIIILLGGRTGRDGIGGATGSSKAHDTSSTLECGAEVQKGNPPTERKLQRLFKREEVSHLIKKCNDFGAGGVSVAIGELADGLIVDLDKVPKKYFGLDGTELAISESQERMAVVVDPEDEEQFLAYALEENLEATTVAVVTEEPRLVLNWRGKDIVNIKRAFLDTNGAHQETEVVVEQPEDAKVYFGKILSEKARKASEKSTDTKDVMKAVLSDINVASQKGLVEMFDGSIGAASVFMPHGGKKQLTPTQSMVAKLPTTGKCDTVSMMSYGFDPYLSSWSPFHGAVYAVCESIARIVSSGGDYKKIRFSFQEYFRRMSSDPKRWSQPFSALLGAYEAQMKFGLPSIGGKDSMSGSFNNIDVPPTLVSFAIDTTDVSNVITPEIKQAGDELVLLKLEQDDLNLVDYDQAKKLFDLVHSLIKDGRVLSSYVCDGYGVFAAVAKMAFGNGFGVEFSESAEPLLFNTDMLSSFILEVSDENLAEVKIAAQKAGLIQNLTVLGEVIEEAVFKCGNASYPLSEAIDDWTAPLEGVFASKTNEEAKDLPLELYEEKNIYVCKNKVAKPKVFIPVFPGTNCEYDSARVFEKAGALTQTIVFKNMNEQNIVDSVDAFAKAIDDSQIVMFPGGFSAGDEPEGSAKFFACAFRNPKIKEAFMRLLNERDGLALGICNGFQALIKLGLVPFGEIKGQDEEAPTLTYNTIGRHISKVCYTKVVSNKSPWLSNTTLGETYAIAASHGEGRFVADDKVIKKLFENGQVAMQYVSDNGNPTTDSEWNVNGSDCSIEGITSLDGRVFGKMCHSERIGEHVMDNIYGNKDMKLFEAGVNYFK